jgi:hypothetical protein
MTHNTMAKSKRHTIQWPKIKDTQYNGQKKTTMIYKTLHRKLKIEPHLKQRVTPKVKWHPPY